MYCAIRTVVMVACFQLALAGIAFADPQIAFEEKEYDFGELEQGKNGECFFAFKNTGDAPLNIKKIKTSCGCTASSTDKDLLEPGEKGTVKVVYKTEKRSGSFRQKIRVLTNDPVRRSPQGPLASCLPEAKISPWVAALTLSAWPTKVRARVP